MPKQKWYLAINGYGFCVTDGWVCDYPIRYDNGNIACDFPERLPAYIKRKVHLYYARGCPIEMLVDER